MNTITTADGEVIDLDTFEIVGRAEGTPTEVAPRKEQKTEVPSSALDKVNQFTWGFNSALFALPDATQRVVGKGLGMKDDEVFQFTRLFNKGERAPQNVTERFVRAIGEGSGAGLPITGTLAFVAGMRPVVAASKGASEVVKGGVLKGIANDTIEFVQKNPRLAAATDIAFGAAYEGFRQAVEETVSDDNPNKKLYTELLPMAALMGFPLAMQFSPTALAIKAGSKLTSKVKEGIPTDASSMEQEAIDSLGRPYDLPIIRIIPKMLIKGSRERLEKVFGPVANHPESQESLALLQKALDDPRISEAFVVDGRPVFNIAEQTMSEPAIAEAIRVLQKSSPDQVLPFKENFAKNRKALDDLFQSFAPETRKPIEEAFMAAQAQRQQFFETLGRQKTDLTDAEIAAVSERLGPQNIDNLNNEVRGVIMSMMEMSNAQRAGRLRRMGMTEGMTEEGLPIATRQGGQSLFDAQDMEKAAISLIEKYKPERPSLSVQVPEPIRLLERFVKSQQAAREKMENDMLSQLGDKAVDDQLAAIGYTTDPEIVKIAKNSVRTLLGVGTEKVAKGKSARGGQMGITDFAKGTTAPVKVDEDIASIKVGSRTIEVNPAQIKEDAQRAAEEATQININAPEALDYLAAALRFRNYSLAQYNTALKQGRTRLTDAQRYLDTGDSVYNDISNLIKDHVPKINKNYEEFNTILDDYRDVFQRNLPLLMAQKTKGGMEYTLPNEALLQKAFQNADSLKQLQTILQNTPEGEDLLMRGTVDWLRTKNVVKDGLVDPKQIRSVLDKNQNIVNALPGNVRAKLQDEVALADAYVARLGELDKREVIAKDEELANLLKKASRPSADPQQTLATALKDPALMQKLTNEMGKDPELLAALRRSVWDIATEGGRSGYVLKGFLDTNQKSLKVLFGDTQHLKDLNTLADLQRRIYALSEATGTMPIFKSTDQRLKENLGFGIQFGTTTAREAATGRISPTTGALALLVRLTGSTEDKLYERIFTKALEDPKFAQAITHVGTPAQGKAVSQQLEKIGVNLPVVFDVSRARGKVVLEQELAQESLEDRKLPSDVLKSLPVVSRETSAQQMLKALPPAPPTRGLGDEGFRFPTVSPKAPSSAGGQIPLMYPTMFPDDPISALLLQRQAQLQGGQTPPPGQ
jgi:hypothetical protein